MGLFGLSALHHARLLCGRLAGPGRSDPSGTRSSAAALRSRTPAGLGSRSSSDFEC